MFACVCMYQLLPASYHHHIKYDILLVVSYATLLITINNNVESNPV